MVNTAGRHKKQPVIADGFNESGEYAKTFFATTVREKCGLAGLKCAIKYGGFSGLDIPEFEFDGFSVTINAKNPKQLINMFDSCISYESVPSQKEGEDDDKQRITFPVLRLMSVNGDRIPETYVDQLGSRFQNQSVPNFKTREYMFSTPDLSVIDSWIKAKCPDISSLPTTEAKAFSKVGYVIDCFANPNNISSDGIAGIGSIDFNTDASLMGSLGSLIFGWFAPICAYIGYVSQVSGVDMKKNPPAVLIGYPDIVDIDGFVNREFTEYVSKLNEQTNEYMLRKSQFYEKPENKKLEFSKLQYNKVATVNQFGAVTKYYIQGKSTENLYTVPIRKSSINGISVMVYILGKRGANHVDSRYLMSNTNTEYTVAIITKTLNDSRWKQSGIDETKRILDPGLVGFICERAMLNALAGGSFAQYLTNDFALLRRVLREKHSTSGSVPELMVTGGDNPPRISVSSILHKNLMSIKNIIESTPNSQGIVMATNILTSVNMMMELSDVIKQRINEYLKDIADRHGKRSPEERNKAIVSMYYALARTPLNGIRTFILYRLPKMLGPSGVIGYEDGKIATLVDKMSNPEMYTAVIMAMRFNSRQITTTQETK